jgi:hypothetical protein
MSDLQGIFKLFLNLVISFRRTLLHSLREVLPSLRGMLPSLRGMLPSLRGMLSLLLCRKAWSVTILPSHSRDAHTSHFGLHLPFLRTGEVLYTLLVLEWISLFAFLRGSLYPSNCGSAITSVLFLVSLPTYSNRDCCGRPELSVMCSGDIQGFTEEQLKIWLEGATNIPFVHIIKKTHKA